MEVKRRQLLLSTLSLLIAARTRSQPIESRAASSAQSADSSLRPSIEAQLNEVFERIARQMLEQQPQRMALLGLDNGAGAWAKSRLNDASVAQAQRMVELRAGWLAELARVDRSRLSGLPAVSYDTVRYQIEVAQQGGKRFKFGVTDFATPYVLSQLNGAYQSIPDFLDSQHAIATKDDAEAYLARLRAFGAVLDQETERACADAAMGVVPPAFLIDKALLQMQALRTTVVEKTTLVSSLERRARQRGISGEWAARAIELVRGPVWSALDRQIALLAQWRPRAVQAAGVARLPDGDAYYAFATRLNTTTELSAAEIHRQGRDCVEQLSAQADELLKRQGLTSGSVGERFATLYRDPRFIYPDTEAGKTQLIADLNALVNQVAAKLPRYFGTRPRAALEIRRVPAAVEVGAPGGSYNAGSLDGSRPGAYYINLRHTAEVPRWTLPTLTYHEGIPGHHLQATLKLEADLPLIRKILGFSAYSEGWALYAEQLADEMGMYAEDPLGRLGYLNDALLRAVRLVVDSGLHARGWSRERAIGYYMSTLGAPRSNAEAEIERYCAWPGQACSYMIGKLTWLDLRAAARQRAGEHFDIRRFHDLGLLAGPMPLDVLKRQLAQA
jgi:uncharacterized protein (DUF885 family)